MADVKKMQLMVDAKKLLVEIDVKPAGFESAMFCAPFDTTLAGVKKYNQEVVSLAQNAQMRIQEGKDSCASKNGNFTREGVLYLMREKPRIVRHSPILYSAKEAAEANKNGREFYPTESQIESALTDSADFPNKKIEIPTNRFDSEALTVWAFGGEKQARLYGEFLKDAGSEALLIPELRQSYISSHRKTFARQVWFSGISEKSRLSCDIWSLHSANWLRGVRVIE